LAVVATAAAGVITALSGRIATESREPGEDHSTNGGATREEGVRDLEPHGPGGMGQKTAVLERFDQDGNGWLDRNERLAARELVEREASHRGPRGRGPGFGPRHTSRPPPPPGRKLAPKDVKTFPDAPLYATNVLRTLFLDFEDDDWEQELADFKNTDVKVPAKLTVDGEAYRDVGVRFHGQSSFMSVGPGWKRSFVLELDMAHKGQRLAGHRKLMLLNSHEDPSFLRTLLAMHIARAYFPAPRVNFVRLVINGESWGVYVNQQRFNKDFLKQWYGTTKGTRWKVPGSPHARGGLEYLGDDVAPYKALYELKSKDDPQAWQHLIDLCRVLNETPAVELEEALEPLLDVDGALRFLAWENVVANGDGYWTRASDYNLYEDTSGRFHIIPYDANETFTAGHGPGGFRPGRVAAPQILEHGDRDGDQKLSQDELSALARAWFDALDPDGVNALSEEQLVAHLHTLLPSPPGFGPPGAGKPEGRPGADGRPRRRGPARDFGHSLFTALDTDGDGSLTRVEFEGTLGKWFREWDTEKRSVLDEDSIRKRLDAVLPRSRPEGRRGPGGPRGGQGSRGVEFDPLVAADDSTKPLLSKLLAVPELRAGYLGYVHDIADRRLDWDELGPLGRQLQAVIAEEVTIDTHKLFSTEAFTGSLAGEMPEQSEHERRGITISLKRFVDERRAFLLAHPEVARAKGSRRHGSE
jgi:hypothetical protein